MRSSAGSSSIDPVLGSLDSWEKLNSFWIRDLADDFLEAGPPDALVFIDEDLSPVAVSSSCLLSRPLSSDPATKCDGERTNGELGRLDSDRKPSLSPLVGLGLDAYRVVGRLYGEVGLL